LLDSSLESQAIVQRIETFAANAGEVITTSGAVAMLPALKTEDVSLLRIHEFWRPFFEFANEGFSGDALRKLASQRPEIANSYRRASRIPRPIARAVFSDARVTCSECDMSQPSYRENQIRSGLACLSCDNCQRLLIPYDFSTAKTRDLMSALRDLFIS